MKNFYDDTIIQIPEDDLTRISLEEVGTSAVLPATHGGFTQLSNYLLRFWTPIIGHQAMQVLIHLIMHTYGKEHTWPSIDLLKAETGLSDSTIRRSIEQLEQYYMVWRITVKDEDRTNKPNRYVVRQTIPLLGQSEYDRLPERLKDDHDEYIVSLKHSRHFILHYELPEYKRSPFPQEQLQKRRAGRPKGSKNKTKKTETDTTP